MTEPFDSEQLIELVKVRPGLWDTEFPADRTERLNLWKEVGAAMYEDWPQCNKAEAYDRVLFLQRKWRSLRDAYNRELRAQRSGVRLNKRIYVYFKRMSFLGGLEVKGSGSNTGSVEEAPDSDAAADINPNHTNTTASPEPSADADYYPESDPLVVSKSKKKKSQKKAKKRRGTSMESDPIEELDINFMTDPDESESDKLFLLSFLPEMRQLPVNIKMWARAQIANVMQEAVNAHCNNINPSLGKIKYQGKEESF